MNISEDSFVSWSQGPAATEAAKCETLRTQFARQWRRATEETEDTEFLFDLIGNLNAERQWRHETREFEISGSEISKGVGTFLIVLGGAFFLKVFLGVGP